MANKVICDVCGNECVSDLVREYCTGRRTLRVCPECQKSGEKQFDAIAYRVHKYGKKSRKPE